MNMCEMGTEKQGGQFLGLFYFKGIVGIIRGLESHLETIFYAERQ